MDWCLDIEVRTGMLSVSLPQTSHKLSISGWPRCPINVNVLPLFHTMHEDSISIYFCHQDNLSEVLELHDTDKMIEAVC